MEIENWGLNCFKKKDKGLGMDSVINGLLAFGIFYILRLYGYLYLNIWGLLSFMAGAVIMTVFHLPIGIGIIIACYSVAISQDEKTMEVYDIYMIISLIALIPIIGSQGFQTFPSDIYGLLYILIPLIFIVTTLLFRGGADTDFLILTYCIYVLLGKDSITILISMFIGYLIQFLKQGTACILTHKSYREVKSERRPFLSSLYLGFLVGFFF